MPAKPTAWSCSAASRGRRTSTKPRLVAAPDAYFVDVITNGHGVMYSYADRVPPADRWAIAAYIRALQRTGARGGQRPVIDAPRRFASVRWGCSAASRLCCLSRATRCWPGSSAGSRGARFRSARCGAHVAGARAGQLAGSYTAAPLLIAHDAGAAGRRRGDPAAAWRGADLSVDRSRRVRPDYAAFKACLAFEPASSSSGTIVCTWLVLERLCLGAVVRGAAAVARRSRPLGSSSMRSSASLIGIDFGEFDRAGISTRRSTACSR